ncbi:hypothetical protein BH20ACT18_BH20ACT18_06280 [soil metagenome]
MDGSPLPAVLFDGDHHIRARTPDGVVDFIPEGLPPLDFDGVHSSARPVEIAGEADRRHRGLGACLAIVVLGLYVMFTTK